MVFKLMRSRCCNNLRCCTCSYCCHQWKQHLVLSLFSKSTLTSLSTPEQRIFLSPGAPLLDLSPHPSVAGVATVYQTARGSSFLLLLVGFQNGQQDSAMSGLAHSNTTHNEWQHWVNSRQKQN